MTICAFEHLHDADPLFSSAQPSKLRMIFSQISVFLFLFKKVGGWLFLRCCLGFQKYRCPAPNGGARDHRLTFVDLLEFCLYAQLHRTAKIANGQDRCNQTPWVKRLSVK